MLNKINFFQLDNLICNRVPFMFYNLSSSVAGWYNSVNKMHVQNYEKMVKAEDVVPDLLNNKVPKEYAIVLLCPDGRISMKLYSELEKMAYTNVYVVDGGYQQLVTERSQV
jgi:rhodanese-related sulfurtransferase